MYKEETCSAMSCSERIPIFFPLDFRFRLGSADVFLRGTAPEEEEEEEDAADSAVAASFGVVNEERSARTRTNNSRWGDRRYERMRLLTVKNAAQCYTKMTQSRPTYLSVPACGVVPPSEDQRQIPEQCEAATARRESPLLGLKSLLPRYARRNLRPESERKEARGIGNDGLSPRLGN